MPRRLNVITYDLEQLDSQEDIVQGMVQVIFHALNWPLAVATPVNVLDCIILSDTSDCVMKANYTGKFSIPDFWVLKEVHKDRISGEEITIPVLDSGVS